MFRGTSAYGMLVMAATAFSLAALVFLSPFGVAIFVLLMIVIVGIPLAVVLAFIPPIALLLVLAAIIAWPFRPWAATPELVRPLARPGFKQKDF